MSYSDDEAKRELVGLLRSNRAVLLAGAGCSRAANYPGWDGLVSKIRALAPDLEPPAAATNPVIVGLVKKKLESQGQARLDAYHNLIRTEFGPKAVEFDRAFHLTLVHLGFRGIVTTNYDPVLEESVDRVYGYTPRCEALNMCDDWGTFLFKFMRELSTAERPTSVLHLHGYYRKPDKVILSDDDYQRDYGNEPVYDQSGNLRSGMMDKLHRRVLWGLLVMHSLVFVGFGIEDEFMRMLSVVRDEFKLGEDGAHFSLVGYETEDDKIKVVERLRRLNITPVFYQIVRAAGPVGPVADHSNLKTLVVELAKLTGTPVGGASVLEMSRRAWER